MYDSISDTFPDTTVHSMELPKANTGHITFPCGLVDRAGTYYLRMVREENGLVLTRTPEINAYWPRFKLTLPSDHQALTNEVSLEFLYEGGTEEVCSPTSEDAVFKLDLIYYDANADLSTSDAKNVINSQEIQAFGNKKQTYVFSCHLFDQAGIYEIHFTTDYQPSMPLATSNPLHSTWSTRYDLVPVNRRSIFPGCSQGITIAYTHPQCSGDQDKIRLYRQIHVSASSPASPTNLNYIGKFPVSLWVQEYKGKRTYEGNRLSFLGLALYLGSNGIADFSFPFHKIWRLGLGDVPNSVPFSDKSRSRRTSLISVLQLRDWSEQVTEWKTSPTPSKKQLWELTAYIYIYFTYLKC